MTEPIKVGGFTLQLLSDGRFRLDGGAMFRVISRVLWEGKEMRCHFSSPIYLDGHLYGIDDQTGSGKLRCLDAKTGTAKWTSKKNGYENLMIAAGKILAVDKDGSLIVVEATPAAYKEIARGTVLNGKARNWTAPVLANGFVYCRNSDGDLVCVDVR